MSSRAQNNHSRGLSGRTPRGRVSNQSHNVNPDEANDELGTEASEVLSRGIDMLGLPVELAKHEKQRLEGLRDVHNAARKTAAVGKNRPLDITRYNQMIALVEDPLWQQADTVALQANTRALVEHLAGKRSTDFDQLWRIVPRVMHCLPPDIFNDRYLECDAEFVSIGGSEMRDPIWPSVFCKALRTLVTHPFFRGSSRMLALVLQYAVKLRTNDRRNWPLENPSTDIFLDDLTAAFSRPHPAHATRDIHKAVRVAIKAQGKELPLISVLLRSLENVVKSTGESFEGPTNPFHPFLMTTVDLRNVAIVLANDKLCGITTHLDGDHIFALVKSALHTNDLPHKVAGVTSVLEMAYQRFGQLAILKERRAANTSETGDAAVNQNQGGGAGHVVGGPGPSSGPVSPPFADISASDARICFLEDSLETLQKENEELKARLGSQGVPVQVPQGWDEPVGPVYSSPERLPGLPQSPFIPRINWKQGIPFGYSRRPAMGTSFSKEEATTIMLTYDPLHSPLPIRGSKGRV